MAKYKKHYMSKYTYPTRLVADSLIIGHKSARKDLEQRLGRALHKDTQVVTRGWNWCFMEPINIASE